jgi:hypothetical protein
MKMGRRKELSSIVNDLTQSLNSRNNDYLGYWVQGQLCKLAKESNVSCVKIDILKKVMQPYSKKFDGMLNLYLELFARQLQSKNLSFSCVSKIYLEFHFNQERDLKYHRWVGLGSPYIFKVFVESDLGRKYQGKAGGYCRPHDQNKELCRNGF